MVEMTLASFEEFGDRRAVTVDLDGTSVHWTYRDLLDRTRREARRLESHGVRRGDVVALLTGDDPMAFVLRWAANVLGAAVTVLPDGHAAGAVTELLRVCGARFLVTDADRYELGVAAIPRTSVETVIDLDASPPPEDSSPVYVHAQPEDLSSISLTGGTTGNPKGVARSAAVPPYFSPAVLAGWRDVVQLLCTPVAHIGGTVALIVLGAGGRVVVHRGFDPQHVIATIPREQVTLMQLMPHLLYRILDAHELATADTSSLRTIRIGSAPASAARIGEAIARLGPIIGQTYGSIEATNITTIGPEELADPELRGTVGRPAPGVELSIRDDSGADLPVGQVGEVWVKSKAVMSGYVNDPQQTAEVLRDGWLRTGDLGKLDNAGYLTLAGRKKEMIIAEDANIYPAEIENVLLAHAAVAEAAVFGATDRDGAESAVAAIVPRPGQRPEPDELKRWVSQHRGPHFVPTTMVVVEKLPLTPVGKIDRATLRTQLAGPEAEESAAASVSPASSRGCSPGAWRLSETARTGAGGMTMGDLSSE